MPASLEFASANSGDGVRANVHCHGVGKAIRSEKDSKKRNANRANFAKKGKRPAKTNDKNKKRTENENTKTKNLEKHT